MSNTDTSAKLIVAVANLQEDVALALVRQRLDAGDDPLLIIEDCQEGILCTWDPDTGLYPQDVEVVGNVIRDNETGSEWNILGQAVSGELAGSQLEPVVNVNHFWFSWAAFRPETRIYQP